MKITVNPNTDAGGFGYAEAGQYRLRVASVELMQGPSAPYLKWMFEFVDPNVESVVKNKDGSSLKIGNVFDNTTLKDGAQFRLRQLCDAAGIEWSAELETDSFIALEFEAHVGIKNYQDILSNEIKKYIPAA